MPNTAPERKSAQAGNSAELAPLLQRLDQVLQQLALWLPPLPAPVRWDDAIAFRWRKLGGRGALQPVAHPLFCWAIDKQRCVGVSATAHSISPASS